ncbi:MAG TPA: 2OG-Fe(II) oxygenase family protein [Micropepsaceae bacterium]|nr:2OG-Fe(II) oxygenase family protein [Micropepsaceae bacterium]
MSAVLDAPVLRDGLDRANFADNFRRLGRVHIPSILTDASAQRLHRCLAQETPWTLVHNKSGVRVDFPYATLEQRTNESRGAWQRAHSDFTYVYDNHRLSHAGEPYPDKSHYLAKLVGFLNSPDFIAFVRTVTGMPSIAFADAQATLYRPGDFLTAHDGATGGKNRLAAYVLNMTPGWRADLGGILEFIDADGHVSGGYVPAFNALNIFRVPQMHCVSQVSLFGQLRYSVTGWFHSH